MLPAPHFMWTAAGWPYKLFAARTSGFFDIFWKLFYLSEGRFLVRLFQKGENRE